MLAIGYDGDSSAYVGDNGKFYLFISEPEQKSYFHIDKYSFINEFGAYENRENAKLYLCEHGREICHPDAVPTLSEL